MPQQLWGIGANDLQVQLASDRPPAHGRGLAVKRQRALRPERDAVLDAAVTVAPVFVAATLLGCGLITLSTALIRRRCQR